MMGRRTNNKQSKNPLGIDLRALRKEIRMIPFGIKKEMRFLDLLFNEKRTSRTQVEKEVLIELIEKARDVIQAHQDKLDRFQKFYNQMRSGKHSDTGLLTPEEIYIFQSHSHHTSLRRKEGKEEECHKEPLRTGTHG
jgi:hypothetical protein